MSITGYSMIGDLKRVFDFVASNLLDTLFVMEAKKWKLELLA